MVEPTHRYCPAGESIKPPEGALVKHLGIEGYGKGYVESVVKQGCRR